jgi:hypothetical protein
MVRYERFMIWEKVIDWSSPFNDRFLKMSLLRFYKKDRLLKTLFDGLTKRKLFPDRSREQIFTGLSDRYAENIVGPAWFLPVRSGIFRYVWYYSYSNQTHHNKLDNSLSHLCFWCHLYIINHWKLYFVPNVQNLWSSKENYKTLRLFSWNYFQPIH